MAKRISALIIIALLAYGLIINCSSKQTDRPFKPRRGIATPNLSLTPPLIPTFTETDTVDPLALYFYQYTYGYSSGYIY